MQSIPRLAAVFMMVAAGLTSCGNATGPIRLASAPEEFTFHTGGFGAESRSYEVRGDTVVFRRSLPFAPPPVRVDSLRRVPSSSEWRTFWAAAEAAGVHYWRSEYRNPDIVDGGGFTMHLRADGRTINTSGSNAYPNRRGLQKFDMPPEFSEFVAALDALLGPRPLSL